MMKRLWGISALLWLIVASGARATVVHSVDIAVTLDTAGTARVTEVWNIDVSTGTEWYLVAGNLGTIEVFDLTVTDETGQIYVNEGDWNTERTMLEKAGRCGIVRKGAGDYELCWGIGSYGSHTFTVSYTMTNFVKGFSDFDGFNHQFVSRGLSHAPRQVRVVIRKVLTADSVVPFVKEETGVWAFGFKGEIHVTGGEIVAKTSNPLGKEDAVIVMARFEKHVFTPSDVRDESFDTIKERAFKGSDYAKQSATDRLMDFATYVFVVIGLLAVLQIFLPRGWKRILYTVLLAPVCFLIVYFAIEKFEYVLLGGLLLLLLGFMVYAILDGVGITSRKPVYGVRQVTDWGRDIPFDGDLLAANYIICKAYPFWKTWNPNIISAMLLRMIQNGTIRMRYLPGEKQPKLSFATEIPSESEFTNHVEYRLYRIIRAAGGKDLTLQPDEFSKWARKSSENGERLSKWMDSTKRYGEKYFDRNGAVLKQKFTRRGQQMARTVPRFKNYLTDFSIINERQAKEVALWNAYLTFASLFGIADKVSKEFKSLYPEYFSQHTFFADMVTADAMTRKVGKEFRRSMTFYKRRESVGSFLGGGGWSSSGGGGGSTGGGYGGGSR